MFIAEELNISALRDLQTFFSNSIFHVHNHIAALRKKSSPHARYGSGIAVLKGEWPEKEASGEVTYDSNSGSLNIRNFLTDRSFL